MSKERMFLITKVIDDNLVILGYVTGSQYPSTLANDHEKQKEQFGYTGIRVTEVSEKCHTKMGRLKRQW